MGSPNGGIIGVINPTSFGKCTVTSVTASGPCGIHHNLELELVQMHLVVAGGGAGGVNMAGGGGAGGFRRAILFQFVEIHHIQLQ
jgi:hypothetical protein